MSVLSTRTISISYSGDEDSTIDPLTAVNSNSSLYRQIVNLSSGNNTITVPTGITVAGVTIIPPSGNSAVLTFKGVNGDTGVALHKTDPSSFGLDTTVVNFVLNAASAMTGVLLIWT